MPDSSSVCIVATDVYDGKSLTLQISDGRAEGATYMKIWFRWWFPPKPVIYDSVSLALASLVQVAWRLCSSHVSLKGTCPLSWVPAPLTCSLSFHLFTYCTAILPQKESFSRRGPPPWSRW